MLSGLWATARRAARAIPAVERYRLKRYSQMISHAVGHPRPIIPRVIVPDIAPTSEDEHLAERLLNAYRLCKAEERGVAGPDVWSSIRNQQDPFFEVLSDGQPRQLAAYLCNMSRLDATVGVTQGHFEYRRILTSPEYQYLIALMIKDKLVSFAEATGALSPENPEQGPWGRSLHLETDSIVDLIETAIGQSIRPPPIDGGLLKIESRGGLFHDRDVHAQYAAWSMKQIAGLGASICEIGGGVGRAAYWSCRFGLGNYSILDLPHINVLQGFYLQKSLPGEHIVLFGEDGTQGKIRVLPYFVKETIPDDDFDLILNQDSLPEINASVALDYLRWIKKKSRKWFYSINQEAAASYSQTWNSDVLEQRQNIVPRMVSHVGGYLRISRSLYWLRRGYTCEIYDVS